MIDCNPGHKVEEPLVKHYWQKIKHEKNVYAQP